MSRRSIGTAVRRGARAWGVLALVAAIGAGWLYAAAGSGSGEMFGGGGGDSVGTLPLMASPPEGGSTEILPEINPATPIFTLFGDAAEVQSCIQTAFPTSSTGTYRWVEFENNQVRVEFYGRVHVVLDRAAFLASHVRGVIMVGTTFQGGLARILVGGQLRAVTPLAAGAIDMRLRALDNAGVLDQVFNWHAISPDHRHRVIEVSDVGNEIHIEQRD